MQIKTAGTTVETLIRQLWTGTVSHITNKHAEEIPVPGLNHTQNLIDFPVSSPRTSKISQKLQRCITASLDS